MIPEQEVLIAYVFWAISMLISSRRGEELTDIVVLEGTSINLLRAPNISLGG